MTGSSDTQDQAGALEQGALLFLPALPFAIETGETDLFMPSVASAKNVSFDPASSRIRGARVTDAEAACLRGLLQRFSDAAHALIAGLFPRYAPRLQRGRASFRPSEIAGRQTTWRHDDTRLHIGSFPATASGGRRILRVFTNVNPVRRARQWRVGEPFEAVIGRFGANLRLPLPGTAYALRAVRLTRSLRTPYDALMLQLHDAMKRDLAYQRSASQRLVEFPAGSTWVAFTDQVSHAAMAGQPQLEQTFLVPVEAMREPERSPLRVLERLKGRRLV